MEESKKVFVSTAFWSLYDDEFIKKKLVYMDKLDAMTEDDRNTDDLAEGLDFFLQLGRKYKFTTIIEDVGAYQE